MMVERHFDEDDETDDENTDIAGIGDIQLKRNISDISIVSSSSKRHRLGRTISDGSVGSAPGSKGRLAAYAQPRYPMFENKNSDIKADDYGISNDDLVFSEIVTSSILLAK
jgi:hypothetical protein